MARNGGKSRGAQPRQTGGGGGKRWPYFVGGLLTGLLLAFGVYLLKILPTALELRERALAQEQQADEQGGDKAAGKPAAGKDGKADGEKPIKFDFYTLLPQQEVVAPVNGNKTTVATPTPIPDATRPATAPGASAPAAAAPAAAPGGEKFLLQAGSFRTRGEADRRRAELLLSGHTVNVQDVKIGSGETWFRVMVGPFGDDSTMQKARQQLAAMKVDTLPIRLK